MSYNESYSQNIHIGRRLAKVETFLLTVLFILGGIMNIEKISLSKIKLKDNFRTNETEVSSLMASIKEHGLLNPVTVQKSSKGFTLVAGHRRYWAAKKLGLKTLSCNVIESDSPRELINLVENLQREETSSYEVGRGISELKEQYEMSDSEVAARLGISVPNVKGYLDLFNKTPKEFRGIIKKTGKGRNGTKGLIANQTALEIVNTNKAGLITANEMATLLRMAKRDDQFTGRHVRLIRSNLKKGQTFKQALVKGSEFKSFNVTFSFTQKQYEKIKEYNPNISINEAIRDGVKDYFGV